MFPYKSIQSYCTADMLIKLSHLLHIASVGWSCLEQAKKHSYAPGLVCQGSTLLSWYVHLEHYTLVYSKLHCGVILADKRSTTTALVCPLLVASRYTQNVDLTSAQSRHVGIFSCLWHAATMRLSIFMFRYISTMAFSTQPKYMVNWHATDFYFLVKILSMAFRTQSGWVVFWQTVLLQELSQQNYLNLLLINIKITIY